MTVAPWTPEDEAAWQEIVAERQATIRNTEYRFGTIGEHELGPVTTNGAWFIVEREDDLAYYGRWKTGCWPDGEVTFPKWALSIPIDDDTREQWLKEAASRTVAFGGDWEVHESGS